MNNTVLFVSPKRQKLLAAIVIAVIFLAVFIYALYSVTQIGKTNLDGTYNTTVGVLTKLEIGDIDEATIRVNEIESVYNFNPIVGQMVDNGMFADDEQALKYLTSLVGKTITFNTPRHLFEENNVWVIGLAVDEQTIVNADDYLTSSQQENKTICTVFTVLVVVAGVACCGLLVWRVNIPKMQEYPLVEKYAEWFADKQPTAPIGQKRSVWIGVASAIVLALMIAGIIVGSVTQNDTLSDIIFIALGVVSVAYIVALLAILPWVRKKNVEYYDKNFPFDLTDLSHMPLPKDIKRQLQENMIAFRKANPDLFADGGNSYEVKFTPDGVELYLIDYDELEQTTDEETEENYIGGSPFNHADDMQAEMKSETDGRTPDLKLTYNQCDFEAVPVFNKKERPLIVVVKSRLKKQFTFPEALVNDMHFILEQPLLDALRRYNVVVEGLDEILADKHRLMTDKNLQKQYNQKNNIH